MDWCKICNDGLDDEADHERKLCWICKDLSDEQVKEQDHLIN